MTFIKRIVFLAVRTCAGFLMISMGSLLVATSNANAAPSKGKDGAVYGSFGGGAAIIYYPRNQFFIQKDPFTAPFIRIGTLNTEKGVAWGKAANLKIGTRLNFKPLQADGMRIEARTSATNADTSRTRIYFDGGASSRIGWVSLTTGFGLSAVDNGGLLIRNRQEFEIRDVDVMGALDYSSMMGGDVALLFGASYRKQRQDTLLQAEVFQANNSMSLTEVLRTESYGPKIGIRYKREFQNGMFTNIKATGAYMFGATEYNGIYVDNQQEFGSANIREKTHAFVGEMRLELGYRIFPNASLSGYFEAGANTNVPYMLYAGTNSEPDRRLTIDQGFFASGKLGLKFNISF